MMISCKKATELVCQSLDRPLSWSETIQLRLHLLMCRGCKAFRKQSEMLDELIQRRFHDLTEESLAELDGLSSSACERLKQRLREATHDDSPQPPAN